jgi:hypothetical protein
MKSLCIAIAALVTLGVMADNADAHTISVGSFNSGAQGSVSIVLGTYSHGAPLIQGSIQLTAGPGTPIPVAPAAFGAVLLSQPIGLVDGVNNFYADSTQATWGTLAADSFNSSTNTVGLGPVVNWLKADFTGLAVGTYTYQITGMTDVNWNNINSYEANWTGTIEITEASTNPVPEPGTFALFGLAAVGAYVLRRRRRQAS